MKIKNIGLITLMLLAVLTIGVASASDDASLDNMTVSDDASDALAVNDDDSIESNGDYDGYSIEVNENEIDINDETEDVATITLPMNAQGNFKILNKEEVVADLKVDANDDDHWIENEYEDLEGTIYVTELNMSKIKNGDNLTFKFFENKVEIESFTVTYTVRLTDTTMELIDIDGEDVDIQVNDINTTKPDENFTYISVAQREGFFIISVEGNGEDDPEIFRVNLNTRQYETFEKNGTTYYRFGFSLSDINNYIAKNIGNANTFNELVDKKITSSGNEIYFELYEDDDETEIDSKTMTFTIKDGIISFKSEDEAVYVDSGELNIPIAEGWQETEVLNFEIRKDIKGRIVIYLNYDETPSYNKTLSELTPDDTDDTFKYYVVTIKDLNITKEGKYTLRYYFYDETGALLYDIEDPEILTVYMPQNMTIDGVTIEINTLPTTLYNNESLVTIDSSANRTDNVSVYVDGNKISNITTIGDCEYDEDTGNYFISPEKLGLRAGEYNLTVSYKGKNLTAKVNITFDLTIELPDDDEIIYTTFNDKFVSIYLEDVNIYTLTLEGKINVTVTDKAGSIIDTLEEYITDLKRDGNNNAYVIKTNDMKKSLNGNYSVVVRYLENNKIIAEETGFVTFKAFNSTDYGASIKDTLRNETDYAITFKDLPLSNNIFVEIDGNKTVEVPYESDLEYCFDNAKKVYYIKYDRLEALADGVHSIRAYIDTNDGIKDLAIGNIMVDLKENIDPALNVTVSDIEEGNAVNILITTNDTFTGEVKVQVADKNYSVSIIKGKGNISITGLKANTYTATAFFAYNGIFNDSTKTATFKVTSKPVTPVKKVTVIKLTLKKVKIKRSAKKLILQATLKINGKVAKGKRIVFKFKGKTYKAKTNKKGVAKVTIKKKVLKKLKAGKKVTYTAKYSTKTVKKTVKVKR